MGLTRTIEKGCGNMKKNWIKIALDLIMAIILVLLFNSHVFSMTLHETGGLFICSLFIIHCLLNKKWIATVTSKFFSKSIPPRVRFGYIIDLLLLISFLFILISGIRTSQVLFPFLADGKDSPWRTVHHFCAAAVIILVGIHLGLHWNFVSNMFKKMIHIPQKISKPLGIILLLVILVPGFYNMASSSFTGWLKEPFVVVSSSDENSGGKVNTGETNDPTPKSGENKRANGSNPNSSEEAKQESSNQTVHTEQKSAEGSPTVILSTMTTYLSIIGVFTAMTYYLEKLLFKKKASPV